MTDTRQPLKIRSRFADAEVEITIDKGEETLAGLNVADTREFGIVVADAIRLHLRAEARGNS